MNIRRMKLLDAQKIFATANTPLYLVRKLRVAPSVERIAREKSGFQIFRALRASLKEQPDGFRDAVLPYAMIVALSLQSKSKYLFEAANLNAPHHQWFDYCCKYLIAGYQTTSKAKFGARQTNLRGTRTEQSTRSSGQTNTLSIRASTP